MILRVGRRALAAFVILAPVMAQAGDGTFGIPPSGILLPPLRQTASLIPPERADPAKVRPLPRMQQTYSPAPADGAGRSRVVPPSEAPLHSPIVVPPKKKQFKAPVASVDPDYLAGENVPDETPAYARVMAQGPAPEGKRGLFTSQRFRARSAPVQAAPVQQAAPAQVYRTSAASAAYQEQVAAAQAQPAFALQPAAAPQRSRLSFSGARPSARANDGTPCGQLRGIFTSPAECR